MATWEDSKEYINTAALYGLTGQDLDDFIADEQSYPQEGGPDDPRIIYGGLLPKGDIEEMVEELRHQERVVQTVMVGNGTGHIVAAETLNRPDTV